MYGYERNDGRPRPSDANYWNMAVNITGTINVGDTVTGATSGKTAVVLAVNGTIELIVTKVSGTFVAENLTVSAVVQATLTSTNQNSSLTPILHATNKGLAADNYRADITAVPGSGPVRGVCRYNDNTYAFRDNVLATACVMHKATVSGWSAINLGQEIQFTAGLTPVPVDGAVLTQGGVTATVKRVLTRTGSWSGGTAAGTFVISVPAGGNFAAGAATLTGGATVTLSGIETAITLLPGGRYEFDIINFTGSATTRRMYGCDGVNLMFEFDGTTYVPIRTGIMGDNPKFLCGHKNSLFMAVDSSVQVSGIGQPYSWTALTGAAELALGDVVTGMKPQIGNESNGALAIVTRQKTFILYGNTTADFQLVIQSPDSGAQPYTIQNIQYAYMLDTRGVTQVNTTRAFGNFEMSTVSRIVQPFIDSKRGLVKASCIVRATNQYRLFFSDGTGLIVYMVQGQTGPIVGGMMIFDYGSDVYMNTVFSTVDSDGLERIFASGSDGFVYELERGTSFDGDNIQAHFLTAFNSSKSPRTRKRYRRAVLQATCGNTANVAVGYDLNFGGVESQIGLQTQQNMIGRGGYWDQFIWDNFNWDAPYVSEYIIDTPGNGRNMAMMVIGDSDIDEPYSIHSAIIHFMQGRQER